MLTLPPSTRVFVATRPADMRRSFDGLLALVREFLGEQDDPLAGHLLMLPSLSPLRADEEPSPRRPDFDPAHPGVVNSTGGV